MNKSGSIPRALLRTRRAGLLLTGASVALGFGMSARADLPHRTVVVSGDPVPGAGPGATFLAASVPIIDAAGHVTFHGILTVGGDVTTANNRGLWTESDAGLLLVARKGSPAPGTPAGAVFDEIRARSGGPTGD